jgi:hypothetical protein
MLCPQKNWPDFSKGNADRSAKQWERNRKMFWIK